VLNITVASTSEESAQDAAQLPLLTGGGLDERGHNGQQDAKTQLETKSKIKRKDERHAELYKNSSTTCIVFTLLSFGFM